MGIKQDIYVYNGQQKGRKVHGEIVGTSRAIATTQLFRRGIHVTSIKKKQPPLFGIGVKPIKTKDINQFTHQLSTMLRAGIPLVQSFDIVVAGLKHPEMSKLILKIKENVGAGMPFATALKQHPKHFDTLFCNLVEVGEQSGELETMLSRITEYNDKAEQLRKKIKKALTYPAAVVLFALGTTIMLLVKVVPTFAAMFSSYGAELPAITQFVMSLSKFFQSTWYLFVIAPIAIYFANKHLMLNSKSYVATKDRWSLKIPVIGNILYLGAVARFARTLATTFAAGTPLVEALTAVANAAGNSVFILSIEQIRTDVSTGMNLNEAMERTGLFPPLALQMAAIGEESGALDDMLERVALQYEEEVNANIEVLTTLLEPAIMAVLAVVVGVLLLSMYMPMFQLGSVI